MVRPVSRLNVLKLQLSCLLIVKHYVKLVTRTTACLRFPGRSLQPTGAYGEGDRDILLV